MWNPHTHGAMPGFWPPKPSGFWARAINPLRRYYLHRFYKIDHIAIEGLDRLSARIGPDDGVLIAPNHSHDSDPHIMIDVGRSARRQFYFMAAWQIFKTHRGIDGWLLQRMGAFSVDREGCDHRALRQAIELLTTGKWLVVFPEGEVFHLNDRLTPLREGVAFMALSAQRDFNKAAENKGPPRRVWIVPTAIRYRYIDDIRGDLEAAMANLESRMMLRANSDGPLHERIIRFGEMMLTIKEKEKLGHSCETDGDLPSRLAHFSLSMLEKLEAAHLKGPGDGPLPVRVKGLRQHLIEIWGDEKAPEDSRRAARDALDDVQLILQLYSYPGDYIESKPTIERMAETLEKFEEDILGSARPKGRRRARVIFGEPIDLAEALKSTRVRTAATEVTLKLEQAIQALMHLDA